MCLAKGSPVLGVLSYNLTKQMDTSEVRINTLAIKIGHGCPSIEQVMRDCLSRVWGVHGSGQDRCIIFMQPQQQCFWFLLQMYNFTSFTVSLNELESGMEKTLPPTDCRLRPDIRGMENGNMGNCWSLPRGLMWVSLGFVCENDAQTLHPD